VVEKRPIDKLTIKGFKTLKDVELELGQLNVLIGPNGAGKSNLISYFEMLRRMVERRLQIWVAKRGGANRILTFGRKNTEQLFSHLQFGANAYGFALESTDDDHLIFTDECLYYGDGPPGPIRISGWGNIESELKEHTSRGGRFRADYCYASITSWMVYHFHDTSNSALVKLTGQLHDNQLLRQDARNLAAYLYRLKQTHDDIYDQVVETVRLAIPFFDDFVLEREALNVNSIMLKWRQKDIDYEFLPSQLSDGSLRFICLVAALIQPDPPFTTTIVIDEPELGLHPHAIHLLGALLRLASQRMQVIVATQSSQLLDEFSVDDLIVVELENGVSVFKRLKEDDFKYWLEDFSVGELWDKNVLGGGIP